MDKLIRICKEQEVEYNKQIKDDIIMMLMCIGMVTILLLALHFHVI